MPSSSATRSESVTMHAISTITCDSIVEPGHLEIDPHQSIVARCCPVGFSHGRHAIRRSVSRVDSRPDACPRSVAPGRDADDREQRRSFHAGRGYRRRSKRCSAVRSTNLSGSGMRSSASSICGFRRRTAPCCDSANGAPWATWFDGGRCNVAQMCIDVPVAEGRGGEDAVVWEGEDGSGPHAEL